MKQDLMMIRAKDIRYMQMCIGLAKRGRPSPEPYVGCVIVKDGKVLSSAFRENAKSCHAEKAAIAKVMSKGKKSLVGATLYTNLEPCCYHTRHPPCADMIIRSGIKRVVCAMRDPHPSVAGRGILRLKKAGVNVVKGVLGNEAKRLNEHYTRYIPSKMPFVAVKAVMGVDGGLIEDHAYCHNDNHDSLTDSQNTWFEHSHISKSCDTDINHCHVSLKEHLKCLQSSFDAILIGVEQMTGSYTENLRNTQSSLEPIMVIVDSKLKIDPNSALLSDGNAMIATTARTDHKKKKHLEDRGIGVIVVNDGEDVDFYKLMQLLGELRITSVMIEGGKDIYSACLEAGIVDRCMLFVIPKIIGKGRSFAEVSKNLQNVLNLTGVTVKMLDDAILYDGYLR